MINRILRWLAVLCVVAILPVGMAAQTAATPPPTTSTLVPGAIVARRVTGSVWKVAAGTNARTQVKENELLAQGDTVVTETGDSSVVLVFPTGATIQLKPDSTLAITKFLFEPTGKDIAVSDLEEEPTSSETDLHLVHGELIAKVAKLNTAKHSSFIVNTPVGAAGIRGTIFRVVFRPDPLNPNRVQFSVSTAEGRVEVKLQGTITTTTPLAVTGNKEVAVVIESKTDPTTGKVTFTPPTVSEESVETIKPEAVTAITQATAQVEQAIENVVISSKEQNAPSETKGSSSDSQGSSDKSSSESKSGDKSSSSSSDSSSSSQSSGSSENEGSGSGSSTTSGSSSTGVNPPAAPPPPPRTTTGDGST